MDRMEFSLKESKREKKRMAIRILRCRSFSFSCLGKVSFGGRELPPLYTPKKETLINLFQITDDEQRKLRTLISSDVAREGERKRKEGLRRAAGAVDRATYLNVLGSTVEVKGMQAQELKEAAVSHSDSQKEKAYGMG